MANELTKEQYLEIVKNMVVTEKGVTNKKCPLCKGNVIVEKNGPSYSIKCENNCFDIGCRGV